MFNPNANDLGIMSIRTPTQAFNDAIAVGVLSHSDASLADEQDAHSNYAGHWMYMYSMDGKDYFKNIVYRNYITSDIPVQEALLQKSPFQRTLGTAV